MKAAAYARFSTDNQTDNSIAYQLDGINKYCADHDIEVVRVFVDEGESGTNTDRKGFKDLVAAASRNAFDAVVIYDISRGSRDVGDWFTFRKAMMMHGIEVISATQRLGDITNPSDFIVELITVGMGQHDVLTSRQKSIAGVAVKAKQGAFLGGLPPLGYDVVDGAYVVNEAETRIVRKIFDLYAAGKSLNYIIDALDGACGKRGPPLGKNSITSALRNDRYTGVYTWNRRKMKLMRKWAGGVPNPDCVRIEGMVPKIFDDDLWERVQKRLNDSRRNASNKAKREYLLSGLIECVNCGAAYVGHTTTSGKGTQNRYYQCGNKYRTRTCHAKNLNADELEVFVVTHLKAYLLDTDFENTAQIIADQVNNASQDFTAERAELAEIVRQINNGTKAILSGMDFPELETELRRLRTRKSELEDIIAVSKRENKYVDPQAIVRMFQQSVENWSPENLRSIIQQHITKIYAHPDGSYEVEVGVHTNGCGGRI